MKKMATRTKPRFPQLENYIYQLIIYLVMLSFFMFFLFQLGE